MTWSWLIWPVGVVLIAAAGYSATYLARRRTRDLLRRTAWNNARAAIEAAGVSRDAASTTVEEAELLYRRAELIAADHGGLAAAREATDHADRADRLWRAAARG